MKKLLFIAVISITALTSCEVRWHGFDDETYYRRWQADGYYCGHCGARVNQHDLKCWNCGCYFD